MAEPITLDEAKAHLRMDLTFTYDDDYITNLIVAAREWAENHTGRSLIPKTLDHLIDCFGIGGIPLPYGPVVSITSVKYIDFLGVEQTLDAGEYVLFNHHEQAFLTLAYSHMWPTTRNEPNAVRIKYVTGYATAADVPQSIKQAMFLALTDMYENRTGQVDKQLMENKAMCALLAPYNMWGGL